MLKKIAIIPARGGSKRILNKNIHTFCDKPMIYWTIKAALNSGIFKRVFVSTDSDEIRAYAISFGAEVPFLRIDNSDDYSNVSDVVISELSRIEGFYGETYDFVYSLMPNCPLRKSNEIIQFDKYMLSNQIDFLLSSTSYLFTNPWWAKTIDDNNNVVNIFKQTFDKRSQDLSELFSPSGAIWAANRHSLINSNTFYGLGYQLFNLNWISALDIDSNYELEIAEYFCNVLLRCDA